MTEMWTTNVWVETIGPSQDAHCIQISKVKKSFRYHGCRPPAKLWPIPRLHLVGLMNGDLGSISARQDRNLPFKHGEDSREISSL